MKVYFAGALFSVAEKNFNLQMKSAINKLNPSVEIILPQDQAQQIIGEDDFEDKVFEYCKEGVLQSDVIIAILEGSDIDSGTCIELGIAYANNKKIIGVRTDFRGSEYEGLNIMVYKVIDYYIYKKNGDNSIDELALEINNVLKTV